MTASGQFVVIASAENVYGDEFLRRLLWALIALILPDCWHYGLFRLVFCRRCPAAHAAD